MTITQIRIKKKRKINYFIIRYLSNSLIRVFIFFCCSFNNNTNNNINSSLHFFFHFKKKEETIKKFLNLICKKI